MYQIDFQSPKHVHFIGIGGISMSGLAQVLLSKGFTVSGSDAAESVLTGRLREDGATIYIGQRASNITDGIDVVVYTAAIHEDNPEFAECKNRDLPMLTRAQLLGQLMKNYEVPVAISGTHGKTTTTSMLSEALMAMGSDPTLSVGGMLKSIGGNIRIGNSGIFVAEACEYTNSFLSFFPRVGIILNIDADHLDFFKDLDDIRASFQKFAALLPENGLLLINGEIPDIEGFTKDLSCSVLTFRVLDGQDGAPADIYATDLSFDEQGHPSFLFHMNAKKLAMAQKTLGAASYIPEGTKDTDTISFPVTLGVVGRHNVSNALSVIATALAMGGDPAVITKAVGAFTGTDRRFEYKGKVGDVTIIDDYAHHPTEIKATLQAAAKYPHKTLRVVFQPHTYTRTKALMGEFAQALSLADEVVLADIYAARETDTLGISSATLQKEIEKLGTTCSYFPTFDEIENFLLKKSEPGDVLITMGAGDVYKIGEKLLGK
ncbi:MAG: UDP-N-acetylmuramate--L-alanine ligase [Lachnospiraceae bacterium]|nr:UDP-N-acetylmuramate--L-alanine ligase [Lachnospiraceae bacterium]